MNEAEATHIINHKSDGGILCTPITESGKKESINPDESSSEDSPINALFKNKV